VQIVLFAYIKVDMVLFSIVLFLLLMITGHSAVYLYIEKKMYKDMELTQFRKKMDIVSFTSGVQNYIINNNKIFIRLK